MNNEMPYSYHTFMYPFFWKNEDVNFKKCIDTKTIWEEKKLDEENECVNANNTLDYATYQYFMPKARKMVFDTEENSISCYQYHNKCIMVFDLGEKPEKLYYLPVNQIRLEFLGNLNIGVLIFETENYGITYTLTDGEKPKKYNYNQIINIIEKKDKSELDDTNLCDGFKNLHGKQRLLEITKINDLGRRVFSPYIATEEDVENKVIYKKAGEAPNKIELIVEENNNPVTLVDCSSIETNIKDNNFKIIQSPDFIEELIFKNGKKIELYPAIDDRMFVICCMGTKKLDAFQRYNDGYLYSKTKKSRYNEIQSQLLYQMIFLERDGNLSCQNREMLQQKLLDHVYARWIDYGTVHGATEYSLVCLTGCDGNGRLLSGGVKSTVINPFLTEYTEMAKIALLQRAEIIKLEDEVSDVSEKIKPVKLEIDNNNIENAFTDIDAMTANINRVRNIWRKYIIFQNELLLPEVTFQEQGVEIYDLLKKSFRIEKLSSYLDTDLNNLHEMAEFEDDAIKRKNDEEEEKNDKRLSTAVNLFSVVGISLAIASAIQDAFGYAGLVTGTNIKTVRQGLWKLLVFAIEFLCLYFLNKEVLKDIEPGKKHKDDYQTINWSLWLGTALIIVIGMLLSLI